MPANFFFFQKKKLEKMYAIPKTKLNLADLVNIYLEEQKK